VTKVGGGRLADVAMLRDPLERWERQNWRSVAGAMTNAEGE
jgi:hypothetical protein